LSLVFRTWRKSKTLSHQKQASQQYKYAFHPTNIPLLVMAIYWGYRLTLISGVDSLYPSVGNQKEL
jgi:hypothetical protein